MKKLAKLGLGALMLAGTAVGLGAPAQAGVHVGIGIGLPGPGYYDGYYRRPVCDPYAPYYDPYYCGYDAYYDGPVFIGGEWYRGPALRWRYWGGERQFWWHGGWHVGTRWNSGGFHRGNPGGWHGGHDGWHGGHDGHWHH